MTRRPSEAPPGPGATSDQPPTVEQLQQFFGNLHELCRLKLRRSRFQKDARADLRALLQQAFRELQSEDAKIAFGRAVRTEYRRALRSPHAVRATLIFQGELRFFNNLIAASRGELGISMDEVSADDALRAGQTIKESIEVLFGLPRWVKRVLTILNLLIGILRGRS